MSSPTSLPNHIASAELWASHIASHADLHNEQRNQRLAIILTTLAEKPLDAIPQAHGDCGQAKGTYRFCANQHFDADDLLQPIVDATTDSFVGLATVLAIQDTTSLNFSSLKTTTGLGPLNDSTTARGLHLHTTLALRDDGVPLGLLDQQYWARPVKGHSAHQRKKLPIAQKESRKWLDGVEAAEAAIASLPPEQRPRLIHIMDREGDIHEVLQRITASPHAAIIRCAQDRSVAGDIDKTFAAVAATAVFATVEIDAPRQAHQPVPAAPRRRATLELRAVTLTITGNPSKHPHRQAVTWTLLDAREINAPVGVEPLHWRLWTNLPAATLEDYMEILRCYGLRWRVEDFHLTFKSGCRIEKLALETAERLIKAAIMYSAVAVRIVALRDLARIEPDAPCTIVLTESEWQVLWLRFAKKPLTAAVPPPTLKQAMLWIGRLGGHMNRKRDGMPGVRTLWRGFRDLSLLAAGFRAGRSLR